MAGEKGMAKTMSLWKARLKRRPGDLRYRLFTTILFYLKNRIVKKVIKENHKEVLKIKQNKKIITLRPNAPFNFNM